MSRTPIVRSCASGLALLMTTAATLFGGAALAADAANPLLAPWSGPYGGVPPFDKAKPAYLKPALEAGMDQGLAELRKIADNPEPATFENTIAAMERSGRLLDRVSTIYGIYSSNMSDE